MPSTDRCRLTCGWCLPALSRPVAGTTMPLRDQAGRTLGPINLKAEIPDTAQAPAVVLPRPASAVADLSLAASRAAQALCRGLSPCCIDRPLGRRRVG